MKICVLGTGAMGTAIAEGLLSSGREVSVYNRTIARAQPLAVAGATVIADVADAVRGADAVILAVFDAAAIRSLMQAEGFAEAARGKSFLNIAATAPDEIVELAGEFSGLGATLSEIAIGAYPDYVKACEAEFILAAEESESDLWSGIFADLGIVRFVGEVGNASKAEMALWVPYMFQTISVAYAIGAFERMGLPPMVAAETLANGRLVNVPSASHLAPEMVSRKYGSAMWSIDNYLDTAKAITGFVDSIGMPAKVLEEINAIYEKASAAGFGKNDVTAIYEQFGPDQ